jgi:hypothetical protein
MTVTIDTDTKQFDVNVDGQPVDGVGGVTVYQYGSPGDKYHEVGFEVATYETAGDVRKTTRLCAAESPGAGRARENIEHGIPETFSKAQASLVRAYNRRNPV